MFIDCILVICSIIAAFGLRFNFKIPNTYLIHMAYGLPFTLLIRVILFLVFRTHSGLIRYSGFDDIKRIVYSIALGSFGFYLLNLVFYVVKGYYFLPIPVLFIDFILCGFFIVSARALAKLYIINKESVHTETKHVLILGAGQHAISTKKTLDQDTKVNYEFYGFIDDTKALKGRQLDGLNIYDTSFDFATLIEKNKIDLLLLCNNKTRLANRQKVLDICLAKGVKILNVPDSDKWINGELSVNQLKEINIESLLERDPIQLDISKIESQINGSKVLVTGGAGSIGSELVRQILKFNPLTVMVLDQAESALYDMELELKESFPEKNFEIVLADIRNLERMRRVFDYFKPDYVYHAAAYKHVPMMENNPSESILTNVFGSINLAKLALEFKVKKFVMISTDKAVNPTNVMGVKIIDLAKNMIKLAGLELGKDINIVSKGLRPGEKLYEELLNDNENSMPTHHEKIMIGKVREYDFEEVNRKINELIDLFETQDNDIIVAKMKELVPEFISNNSTFSRLDKPVAAN